jgi:hypothetical protein
MKGAENCAAFWANKKKSAMQLNGSKEDACFGN